MTKIVEKNWGFEGWLVNNELYCAKLMMCKYGEWTSQGKWHYHKKKDETFYVLDGALHLEVEGILYPITEGESFRVKPGEAHRFTSISKTCTFLEISTHHEDSDSYRIKRLEDKVL